MKVAIVTGAIGGIGKESAIQLCRKGYAVVGMDVVDTPDLSAFDGLDFTYVKGDLASEDSRAALVKCAADKGTIAALVNVAGVAPKVRRDILEMTEESYDFVMGINTKGTLFLTQAVANKMIEEKSGGSIVNISSCSAYTSSTSRGEYCISKAGVSMTTLLFADKLAEFNIPVFEVRPGIIKTPMTDVVSAKYDKLIAEGITPIKRWGTPEDVANCVIAAASGLLDFGTGTVLNADGGFHIRRL